jgi:hypothetical protein
MQRMTTVVGRVGVVGQGVVTRGKNRNTSISRITTRSTRFLSSNPWNVSLWPVSQKTSLYNICPKVPLSFTIDYRLSSPGRVK